MARALLLDYLKCDLAGGNKAFIEYSDKQTPLRLAEEFEAILSTSPMLLRLRAGILRQLRNYTADRSATRQGSVRSLDPGWTLKENSSGLESPKPWYLN